MAGGAAIPKYSDFFKPTIDALVELGGSATIDELDGKVVEAMKFSSQQLEATYPKSGGAIIPDRIAWSRSWLKIAGLVENPSRGLWVLTESGRANAKKTAEQLKAMAYAAYKKGAKAAKSVSSVEAEDVIESVAPDHMDIWPQALLERIRKLDPNAFERLCQRFLREYGFSYVKVTGRSGDGGIDGMGILQINLISFQVIFQCKRWKNAVGAAEVRNFRGAMQGRADKGFIIATATFTAAAKNEANRDGVPVIDLIDGNKLCELMQDRKLGVDTKEVVEYSVNEKFFDEI